jgi:hypothetical protein
MPGAACAPMKLRNKNETNMNMNKINACFLAGIGKK